MSSGIITNLDSQYTNRNLVPDITAALGEALTRLDDATMIQRGKVVFVTINNLSVNTNVDLQYIVNLPQPANGSQVAGLFGQRLNSEGYDMFVLSNAGQLRIISKAVNNLGYLSFTYIAK